MIPLLLLASGVSLKAYATTEFVKGIAGNLIASGLQGGIEGFWRRLRPEQSNDLRRVIVLALSSAAKTAISATRGPIAEGWRALERGAETAVPAIGSANFDPLARAFVVGEDDAIRDAVGATLTNVPGFPSLAAEEHAEFLASLGSRVRRTFLKEIETGQSEQGFRAFLLQTLTELRADLPDEAMTAALGELPDLVPALRQLQEVNVVVLERLGDI